METEWISGSVGVELDLMGTTTEDDNDMPVLVADNRGNLAKQCLNISR